MGFEEYLTAARSRFTRDTYRVSIRLLLGCDPDGFVDRVRVDRRGAEGYLLGRVVLFRERWKASTLVAGVSMVKSFLDFEEVDLNWRKVRKAVPKARFVGSDRPVSLQETRSLLGVCDLRMRAVVLVMGSSGVRVGAFDYLDVGDYERLSSGVGRLRVYKETTEEYWAFVSGEACEALDMYLKSRRDAGEVLQSDSPLIRNKWDSAPFTLNPGVVHRMTGESLGNYLYRLWMKCGLKKLGEGRGVFKASHCFRKFFKTRAGQIMKSDDVELLMGHSLGLADSYYKPPLEYLEKEYLKAVPLLTISESEEVRQEYEGLLAGEKTRVNDLEDRLTKQDLEISDIRRIVRERLEKTE